LSARMRSRTSVLFYFSVPLLLIVSAPMRAQFGSGTVNSDSVPVYAATSADSDVVSTLARGKKVSVTLSITNSDGAWCGISDIDSSQKLGYVHCNQLDREKIPSTAATGTGALPGFPVGSAVANQSPSRAQQNWALAASAIVATHNHEPLDTLSSGGTVLGTKRMLQDWWGISNRDQLLQSLEWIDQGGHRQLFSALGARTASLSPEDLSRLVSQLDPEDANSLTIAHRYYGKYSTQSITAWDYGRYINVCRWGVAAGYLSEDEAWPRVMHAAQILQQTFTSWSEFGENYLVGREFWSLSQTKIDGQQMRAIYARLLNDGSSPWNRIPWGLSLQQSANSPSSNSPNLPEAANSGLAGGPCESLESVAASGQSSSVETILETKPDPVNCRDSRGWTPLHYAAFNGQTKMIQLLIAHGGAVNATDKDGATPMHVAASAGYPDAIEALLQGGARIDAQDHSGKTALLNAASEGSVPAAEVLLAHRASTEVHDSSGCTPLSCAAAKGLTDVVRLLVEHGANLESRENDGYTPLNIAAWFGHFEVAALLLAANADVNSRSKDGTTPLHGAAASGSVQLASLLLEHGAHLKAGNLHGFTPLHLAADNDQPEAVEFLLAQGAEINARTDSGDTPLHWAAYNGRMAAATLLLEKGAEVNPKDKDGNTPLHWAVIRGHVEMTELLIAHGADLSAKTRLGCTPLRGAHDYHQAATAQVLIQHGATQ
jgi:ankyrin repeat protein